MNETRAEQSGVTGAIIVIGGVCGTGKTTVGTLLSETTGLPFYDADDFHPEANKEKMGAGHPLSDQDRWPWLQDLAEHIADWAGNGGGVLACSALKESYRVRLSSRFDGDIDWIFLTGSETLLTQRLERRAGHFMGAEMLRSQLDVLELPDYGYRYDVARSAPEIVASIVSKMR